VQHRLALFSKILQYHAPMLKKLAAPLLLAVAVCAVAFAAAPAKRKILFFTKSSGFEHSVISWKNGQPSHAEKVLLELGAKNGWEFEFSKDGSKFSKDYLAQFDAVFFYTTGDLCSEGTDKQPPMSPEGKQALFDFVKAGKGFIGTHSASDTFHTNNESRKARTAILNHGDKADAVCALPRRRIHQAWAQQDAKNTVTNPNSPALKMSAPNTASWRSGIR
jgi:hypothetical protein